MPWPPPKCRTIARSCWKSPEPLLRFGRQPLFCRKTNREGWVMILHSVFVRFKAALQQADKQSIYESVVALKDVTPGILDVKYGPNVSSEGLNGGFRDGFVVTFESPEARDAYLVHPDHITVGERIIASTDGGLS